MGYHAGELGNNADASCSPARASCFPSQAKGRSKTSTLVPIVDPERCQAHALIALSAARPDDRPKAPIRAPRHAGPSKPNRPPRFSICDRKSEGLECRRRSVCTGTPRGNPRDKPGRQRQKRRWRPRRFARGNLRTTQRERSTTGYTRGAPVAAAIPPMQRTGVAGGSFAEHPLFFPVTARHFSRRSNTHPDYPSTTPRAQILPPFPAKIGREMPRLAKGKRSE
jgi:hypothetical protein